MTAESGGLQKLVNDLKEKTCEAVASAEQLQANVSSVTGERDPLTVKLEELAHKGQSMSGLTKEAKSLRTRVADLEKSSKTKAPKVRAKRRISEMEEVAEQARIDHFEHTAWTVQLEGDLHELEGKLDFVKRCNDVTDSRYSLLVD